MSTTFTWICLPTSVMAFHVELGNYQKMVGLIKKQQ